MTNNKCIELDWDDFEHCPYCGAILSTLVIHSFKQEWVEYTKFCSECLIVWPEGE